MLRRDFMVFIERPDAFARLEAALEARPVVGLVGPRQCGKTSLARQYVQKFYPNLPRGNSFDLENLGDLARLENPLLTLESLSALVVIDEVQHQPEVFKTLRVLADRPGRITKFLVLGCASGELLRQSSESLASRIRYIELSPFELSEVGSDNAAKLWVRGGFPESFLAPHEGESYAWRSDFIDTFLQRDLAAGLKLPALTMRRFWTMLAHLHGGILNLSDLGRSLGISDTTARRYVDALADAFMVRLLLPWHENIGSRQVKRPKVYIRDSGLLHALLSLRTESELGSFPRLGASWEGFALEETIRRKSIRSGEAYFWAIHEDAELDLLHFEGGKRRGYEFKYTDSPKVTRSMRRAIEVLGLDSLAVVVPRGEAFRIDDRIEVVPLASM
jgi:predicted AAA+ superfamily ATPase